MQDLTHLRDKQFEWSQNKGLLQWFGRMPRLREYSSRFGVRFSAAEWVPCNKCGAVTSVTTLTPPEIWIAQSDLFNSLANLAIAVFLRYPKKKKKKTYVGTGQTLNAMCEFYQPAGNQPALPLTQSISSNIISVQLWVQLLQYCVGHISWSHINDQSHRFSQS